MYFTEAEDNQTGEHVTFVDIQDCAFINRNQGLININHYTSKTYTLLYLLMNRPWESKVTKRHSE
jgi:hypothetical protein